MARTDYGAILSTKIADTSQAIRDVEQTVGVIAPAEWGSRIRAMKSQSDYDNVMAQLVEETTTPAAIASFTDGANNLPVKEIVCQINPTETGSGAKSPSNQYVIGGHSEINITQQSTIPVTDNAPYLFRQSGGDNNADVYNQETDKLVGASAVVNQLVQNGNFADTSNWTTYHASKSVANNELTETVTSGNDNGTIYQDIPVVVGHKYFVTAYAKVGTAEKVRITYNSAIAGWTEVTSSTYTSTNKVGQATNSTLRVALTVYGDGLTGMCKDFNVFDLTQMFGSTIADYIYSLEQGTAGSGIAYLRKYGFFTKGYYPYTANALQSVNTSAHITTGVNRWDEEWEQGTFDSSTGEKKPYSNYWRSKNRIAVLPNTTYYAATSNDNIYRFYYDISGNYIGSANGVSNQTFTTPNGAYYLNIVDVTRNSYDSSSKPVSINYPSAITTYNPYVKHEYALPNIDLRGLYKLDASNNLYADGDTLEGDGTVTRKYGIVDLGTLSYYRISTDSYYYCVPSSYKIGSTNFVVAGFTNKGQGISRLTEDKTAISFGSQSNRIVFRWDEHLTDTSQQFATAMSGVYLVYELATPTTETITGFTNPQLVSKDGTEEYTDERNFPLPVGHETIYLPTGQREYHADFGQTVYGGEFVAKEGEFDKVVPTWDEVDLGSLNWRWYDDTGVNGGYYRAAVSTKKNGLNNLIADIYETVSVATIDMTNFTIKGTANSTNIYIRDSRYSDDVAGLIQALTGTKLFYELATPTEIVLPTKTQANTLLGANNLYHDCNGNIEVNYRANGALYVAQH